MDRPPSVTHRCVALAVVLVASQACTPLPHPVDGLDDDVVQLVGVWDSDLYCVLRRGGDSGCFHMVGPDQGRYVPLPLEPGERVVDLALDAWKACAVLEGGRARCWEVPMVGPLEFLDGTDVEAGVFAMEVWGDERCVLATSGQGRCTSGLEVEGAVDLNASCLLSDSGDVHCPEGVVSIGAGMISLARRGACGTRADGTLVCWEFDGAGLRIEEPAPPTLDARRQAHAHPTGSGGCVVDEAGRVGCWGEPRTYVSRLDDQPGMMIDLDAPAQSFVDTRYASCALFEGGAVRCWPAPDQPSFGGG